MDNGMLYIAWKGIEDVPYYFTRPSNQFQGDMGQTRSLGLDESYKISEREYLWFK